MTEAERERERGGSDSNRLGGLHNCARKKIAE